MKTQPEPTPGCDAARDWLQQQRAELRDDCEHLLLAHLNWDRARLRRDGGQPLSSGNIEQLRTMVQRLETGEPLAYLLGEQPFHNIALNVDPRVLVPRSDTETLVELALEYCKVQGHNSRVLDLGTGSGAIAIALANAMPSLRITATDASRDALAVADANVQRWQADIKLLQSNWFGAVTGCFDLIVSNPPYIAANDPHLPDLQHEPGQALVAGTDGLSDLRIIIDAAPAFLEPGGTLMVEHGYDQQQPVADLFASAGFAKVRCERDLGNRPRVTLGLSQGQRRAP
ncbi:MAG: peptide chain release factor N(5)-glutamine methyltransferase [Pseudomonadales bacterium]